MNDSIHYTPRNTSLNPLALSPQPGADIARASVTLHAPLPFFGHSIAVTTDQNTQDGSYQINNSTLLGGGASRSVRAAAGRAAVHEILAQEKAADAVDLRRARAAQAQTKRYVSIADSHRDCAASSLRSIAYSKRLAKTLEKSGNFHGVKKVEQDIQRLENQASYHTAAANEIDNLMHGLIGGTPGALHVMPIGNYEIEFPVKGAASRSKAEKVTGSDANLNSFAKTKARLVIEGRPFKIKKFSSQLSKKNLPLAKQVSSKAVVAELPRDFKIPLAKVSSVSP